MSILNKSDGKGISKTKLAALIGGVALFAGTLASAIQGNTTILTAVLQTALEVAGIYGVSGIRDIPLLNKQ
jgi:hypothetical protein